MTHATHFGNMGRKCKPSANDVASRGVPTLGRLLGLESRSPLLSSDVPEPTLVVDEPQELILLNCDE
jgi:hypothetical protein